MTVGETIPGFCVVELKPEGLDDQLYETPLYKSTVIDQFTKVPPEVTKKIQSSSNAVNVQFPLGFPVRVFNAFSG